MRWVVLVAVVGAACSSGSADPAKLAAIERRLGALETRVADKQAEADTKASELSLCLTMADADYWSYIRLNGRRVGGTDLVPKYRASNTTWDTAARDKANAIEECKARWK